MKFDPEIHHRRSIRLKGYDYSQPGAYFVTICTQDRACLFGEVVNGVMRLNDARRMVEKWWAELNRKFPDVQTDEFIVMPNHVHGIIVITSHPVDTPVGADLRVCPNPNDESDAMGARSAMGAHRGAPLPQIIQWFKTMTTNEYIRAVKQSGWLPFRGRLWQRNYYEHIIRNDGELRRIREYITNNPLQWALDQENPNIVRVCSEPAPTGNEPWRI